MPRRATGPKYYPSRGDYYVTFRGKRHCLARGPLCWKCAEREKAGSLPTCTECKKVRYNADLRFAELIHLADVEKAEDNALVFALCTRYLKMVQEKRKPKTYALAHRYLNAFGAEYGHLKVKQVKGVHVEDWLAMMARPRTVSTPQGERVCKWGPSTQRMAHQVIQAMFNWSVKKGLITRNPVAGVVECPSAVSRTKDSLITPEQHRKLLDYLLSWPAPKYRKDKGYFACWNRKRIALAYGKKESPELLARAQERLAEIREKERKCYDPYITLLRLLEHTGARPGELYYAEARHWNSEVGAFVYPRCDAPEKADGFTHKTARKKKDRTVYVGDPQLRAEVERLCAENPEGPILRNYYGKPWTDKAVLERWRTLRQALELPRAITPYSYRHTSITNMLLAGHPTALVAEVHGTSIDMITRFYGHLDGHKQAMAAFWARAKASQQEGGTAGPLGVPPPSAAKG
jgi:integrase